MSKLFMRLLGVVNILFVGVGIWYSVEMHTFRIGRGKWPPYPPARVDWLLYFAFLALSVALVGWLSYLSIRLIRTDRKALLPSCIVFGIEIVYFLVDSVFFFFVPQWVTDRSWFWTMGMDPVIPQLAYCYPFLAIPVTLALFLTTRNQQSPPQILMTPLP